MATTIARLAAYLTLDDSDFAANSEKTKSLIKGLKSEAASLTQSLRTPTERIRDDLLKLRGFRAGGFITDETFRRGVAKLREEYDSLGHSVGQTSGIMSRFLQRSAGIAATRAGLGPTAGLVASAGPIAAVGVAAAAAAAGVVLLSVKLARIADASRDARLVTLRDALKSLDEIKGTSFASGITTAADEAQRLKDNFAQTAELSGLTLRFLNAALATKLGDFNNALFGESAVRAQQESERLDKAFAERAKKAAESAKAQAEAEKKAIEETQHEFESLIEKMKARGDSLTDSLATPIQRMRKEFSEFERLLNGGFISAETFRAGLAKTGGDFIETELRKLKDREPRTSGAFELGTTQEFSARIQSQLQSKRLEETSAATARATAESLKELRKISSRPEAATVKFTVGGL